MSTREDTALEGILSSGTEFLRELLLLELQRDGDEELISAIADELEYRDVTGDRHYGK